ncbi:MAG: hypothetical protein AB1705_23470, partial [Verrucomicrobiota bacterium]
QRPDIEKPVLDQKEIEKPSTPFAETVNFLIDRPDVVKPEFEKCDERFRVPMTLPGTRFLNTSTNAVAISSPVGPRASEVRGRALFFIPPPSSVPAACCGSSSVGK